MPRAVSLAQWRRILADLEREDDLARLESACTEFPDQLRLAPGRWLRRLFEGERSASHREVRELALASGITDRGATLLAEDDRLAGLSSLALFRNEIGAEGVAALLGSRHLGPRLERLLLGRNRLGLAGARALAGETGIEGLALLDLDCNRLDGAAICELVQAPLLRGVRTLNLSNNPIGAQGCAALAGCSYLSELEVLFLHGGGSMTMPSRRCWGRRGCRGCATSRSARTRCP